MKHNFIESLVTHYDSSTVGAVPQKNASDLRPDEAAFRDLVFFEARLRQNKILIEKVTRRWRVIWWTLIFSVVYFSYLVWQEVSIAAQSQTSSYIPFPQTNPSSPPNDVHDTHALPVSPLPSQMGHAPDIKVVKQQELTGSMIGFIVSITLCALFIFSGLYKQKLLHGSRFVEQCNRALKPFNMIFDASTGEMSFSRKIPQSFQEGFSRHRQAYYKRREIARERRRQAAKKLNSGSTNSPSSSLSKETPGSIQE